MTVRPTIKKCPVQQAASQQRGFTLLELIVAMAIFAVLAVAGWQVFDSLNRSKERAELQTDVLTQLQYGYGQIQRDMMQVAAYTLTNTGNMSGNGNRGTGASAFSETNTATPVNHVNGFQLQNNQLSFIRYRDPDPRYKNVPALERIVYRFNEDDLVRERYQTLGNDTNERPLQSVLISGVSQGQFQVLTPAPMPIYPPLESAETRPPAPNGNRDIDKSQDDSSNNIHAQLPHGVQLNFTIGLGQTELPVRWLYALPSAPPEVSSPVADTKKPVEENSNEAKNETP